MAVVIGILVIVGVLLLLVLSGLRVVQEYERAVIFYLGRSQGAKGPGVSCGAPLSFRFTRPAAVQ